MALLTVTCGVAVGILYFPQAITPLIATGLGISPGDAAKVAAAAPLGYAAGIFLLVPLGDRVAYRSLVVGLLALTGLGLLAAAAAPSLLMLVVASTLVGTFTVVAQVIAPMAAGLAAERRRGEVLGTLLSGSIAGMLLARALAGIVGESFGWRAPYLVAAGAAVIMSLLLARTLPRTRPPSRQPYRRLLAEPLRLLRSEPDLRRSAFYQASIFGGFSAVWTAVALLLTGPVYDLDTRAAGLLALVGAGTLLCTRRVGRIVDRRGPDRVNLLSMLAVLASAAILALGSAGGGLGLTGLVVGTLLLDVAMQSGMVANHTRVFALRGDARARLSTAYMTCAFLGGSAGAWLGTLAYRQAGWLAVCVLLALLAASALSRHLAARCRSLAPEKPLAQRRGSVRTSTRRTLDPEIHHGPC